MAEKGIRVILTVSLGLENTFDFCFNGIEKGSTVAVSTYMASTHGNRADQKEFFMTGYNEMLKRIEPETIICYHYPFPEMKGNILFVDYDLSSWQHYGDDGRANNERQFTDHGNPSVHSNPHDNKTGWNNERGNPEWLGETNYFDGNIPEFKHYKMTGEHSMSCKYDFDYKTKYEFKDQ